MLKKRNKYRASFVFTMAISKPTHTTLQLPKKLEDPQKEWMRLNCGDKGFKSNTLAGKSRLIKG